VASTLSTLGDTEHRRSGRLRVVADDQTMDLEGAERAVRDLLVALGRDPSS